MGNTKIKIEYGQIKFEVESDAETAAKERDTFLQTLPLLFSLNNTTRTIPQEVICEEKKSLTNDYLDSPVDNERKYQNINTFLNEKCFCTNNDKCLAFAFYMQEQEDVRLIDTNSIKERMKKARVIIPNNISLAINQNTKKGYMQPVEDEDSQSSYYVTNEGIKYINSFKKNEKSIKSTKKVSKKISKKIDSKYFTLNKTIMNLEKYPSVTDLKTTKDKILLLMFILKDNNLGEFFTVNDIMYIMSKIFNERITVDMVKGQFKNPATKMFYDKQNIENNKKVYEYKLLAVGEKYVKENILNN